jgi:WD40 repeat protein
VKEGRVKKTLKKIAITLICSMECCCLRAGMGTVHAINPQPTKPAWMTAFAQGTLLDEVTAQPILNSDAVSGIITINQSGRYQLVQDLVYPIFIGVSDVSLDLGLHAIVRSALTDNLITVSAAVSNVSIFNGSIKNTYLLSAGDNATTGGSGVYINAGCTSISLGDLVIIGCAYGVRCVGSGASMIANCELARLKLLTNAIGISLLYTYATVVRSCSALYATQTGFDLTNCQTNCLEDCYSLKLTSTTTAVSFKSTQGTSNMFQRCVAKQTKTSSTTVGEQACGFLLTGTEQKTKIIDCIVNGTDVVNTQTAVTCGINLAPVIQPTTDLLSTVTLWTNQGRYPFGIAWSPNNNYLAVTFNIGNLIKVYSFDGANLLTVASASVSSPYGIVWSPDGKYLACGTGGGATNLYVYSFNGQTLTSAASFSGGSGTVYGVAWSPNGKYVACADTAGTGYVRVLSFSGSSLSQVSFQSLGSGTSSYNDVAWSPDGTVLAVAWYSSTSLFIIPVTLSGQLGTAVTLSSAGSWASYRVQWSPNGRFLAVVGGGAGTTISVFRWQPTDVTPIAPVATGGYSLWYPIGFVWSPDGAYIATVNSSSATVIASFNGTSFTLVKTAPSYFAYNAMVMAWSSDGKYLAVPENHDPGQFIIYTTMYGPLNCLIDNCRVCDTATGGTSMGRGIVMGGSNMCTRTVAGNNGVNYSYGIPNVYDGRFEITRNVVQPFDNISLPSTV